jgi:hypothetical protein
VNAIAPGVIDTAQPRYGMTEDEIAAVGASTLLGRNGEALDVARVAVPCP